MPSAADEPLEYDLLIVQVCEFLDNGDGIHRFHGPSQAGNNNPKEQITFHRK